MLTFYWDRLYYLCFQVFQTLQPTIPGLVAVHVLSFSPGSVVANLELEVENTEDVSQVNLLQTIESEIRSNGELQDSDLILERKSDTPF